MLHFMIIETAHKKSSFGLSEVLASGSQG